MTQKEKLISLLRPWFECEEDRADYLIKNGVIVLSNGEDDELTTSILHCLEIADNESICEQCKQEHLQLASWLNELKERRMEATTKTEESI